jgi:hypothetical protein
MCESGLYLRWSKILRMFGTNVPSLCLPVHSFLFFRRTHLILPKMMPVKMTRKTLQLQVNDSWTKMSKRLKMKN